MYPGSTPINSRDAKLRRLENVTTSTPLKTKRWFIAAALLALLALYCFAGAVMTGSFAVGGGTQSQLAWFHQEAVVYFWLAASTAAGSVICVGIGIVRLLRKPQASQEPAG